MVGNCYFMTYRSLFIEFFYGFTLYSFFKNEKWTSQILDHGSDSGVCKKVKYVYLKIVKFRNPLFLNFDSTLFCMMTEKPKQLS